MIQNPNQNNSMKSQDTHRSISLSKQPSDKINIKPNKQQLFATVQN